MGNQQLSRIKKHAEGNRGVFQRINVKLREIYPKCVIRQQTVPENNKNQTQAGMDVVRNHILSIKVDEKEYSFLIFISMIIEIGERSGTE